MAVLLVVLSLLVLCAPFLLSARNADRASVALADRAQARVWLDAGARHARARLGDSHPGLPDLTPYADSVEELSVDTTFDPGFLNPNDPTGPMWDLDVRDVSGLIDLNSAPPQVLANAMGLITRTSDVLAGDTIELALNDPDAFGAPKGFIVINGEYIEYSLDEEGEAQAGMRGVGTVQNEDGDWLTDGPRPPSGHGVGSPAMDQRSFAPVIWRMAGPDDNLREFDTVEQLRESDTFALVGGVGDAAYSALGEVGSVHAGFCAGDPWQKPVRLVTSIQAGLTLSIAVEDARYINEGSTIWVGDSNSGELRYVQTRSNNGRIGINAVFDRDYMAWETQVRVLARRPINVNTASESVLRILFENLQLRNHNSRITEGEAESLAKLTLESRPFEGLEDWMRRIVLPSAGIEELPGDAPLVPDGLAGNSDAVLSATDALALYVNSLNANDASLAFSTMPLCFTSRDVYDLDLRASVNAPSGIERTHLRREQVEWMVPSGELFTMWGTQASFDEAMRLSRRSTWWASGPEPTSQWDGSTVPPSRVWPHMGTVDGRVYLPGFSRVNASAPEPGPVTHVFASPEDDAWLQLWPSRLQDQWRYRGRTLHFDHETRDLEGRYLPDETLGFPINDKRVAWADPAQGGLLEPILFDLWVKPTLLAGGYLLDVGGGSRESDRLSLLLEGEDLVLRVLDGFGDHLDTPGFTEASEVRMALAEGEGPGLPADTWSHLSVEVNGTRPDQLGLMVNGFASGVRRPGMSRLSAPASQGAGFLALEDLEGFPSTGVVRVGNELVEYTLGSGGLEVAHAEGGSQGGRGGRLARTRWNVDDLPSNLGGITTDHPAGAPVFLYGYSTPLASNLPSGGSNLAGSIGPFRVARVIGVDAENGTGPDPILGGFWDFGDGYEATNMSGLILALGDDPESSSEDSDLMSAFSSTGGYAALVQQRWAFDETGASAIPPNAPLGGLEIIRYSGYTGSTLNVVARGDVVAGELPRYGALDPSGFAGGVRVFVTDWENTVDGQGDLVQGSMRMGTYCVPISLPAPNADDISFLPAANNSEFAQLTHADAAEHTEWVRYDTVAAGQGQLVRDREAALLNLYAVLTLNSNALRDLLGTTDGNGGGGAGGGGGGGGGGGTYSPPAPPSNPAPPSPPMRALGAVWDPLRGESELDDFPLSRAVASVFQFRGVLGTHSHDHAQGTQILPVFHLFDRGVDGGRPGKGDAVFVSDARPDHIGWPMVVERAHLPASSYVAYGWTQDPDQGAIALPSSPETIELGHTDFPRNRIYLAFNDDCPEPITPGAGSTGGNVSDPRLHARISKFPSGERPRIASAVAVGSVYDAAGGEVPSIVVDEVSFGTQEFLRGLPSTSPSSHSSGAQMVLALALDESAEQIQVAPRTFVVPGGRWAGADGVLGALPEDGGLLRIGDEIMAYAERDESLGQITLAPGGRGVLGTEAGPHQPTEAITFMEGWAVSTLAAGIGPGDATIALSDVQGFGSSGTILIDDELIHFTRQRSDSLEMPRAGYDANDPQTETLGDNGRGRGLFRGRFGTVPTGHAQGALAISFPFRYWDRWAEQADAPELAYFGFELEQPGAFWTESFWDAEPATHGQCHIAVMQRTDPKTPWDGDPEEEVHLQLLLEGREDDAALPLGVQSERIDWRVFVRYDPGAFDALGGLSHGWKETPRFKRLGVGYSAPGQVLRSVDK